MTSTTNRKRFWRWLIRFIGLIVPRDRRADWRQKWEAELQWREQQLAEWDKLNNKNKRDLLWHSAGAFVDALWLQPKRWEDEMIQDFRYCMRMPLKQPGYLWMTRLTLGLCIGVTLAFQLAAQTAPANDSTPAFVRGVKVDVGGYNLQLFCSGRGKPTIVVAAGRASQPWKAVVGIRS